MKYIFITTKESEDCYNIISENWFEKNELVNVKTNISIDTSKQAAINIVKVASSDDFCAFLPECVNPGFVENIKSDYVLDLACSLAEQYKIERENFYLIIHAGDFFSLGDSRRITGRVSIDDIPCSTEIRNKVLEHILSEHIYCFRHDENAVKTLLIDEYGDNISVLASTLIDIVAS